MSKKLLFAFIVSLFGHMLLLSNLKTPESDSANTYDLKNGLAQTKISIRLLDSVKKTTRLNGDVKTPITKSKNQKVATSGSEASKSSGNQKALSKYLSAIRGQMVLNQYKSRAAIKLNQKGVVKISFDITYPNLISKIKVLKQSSYEQLDYSAVRTIESLQDLPSIPNELNLSKLSVQIDITYP